jgi:GT2 family glycosyltransferase
MYQSLSVCIPTYRRPDLLVHCLESVFTSTVRPLEVVVSDDAHEPALARRLEALPVPAGIEVRYSANPLERGEAGNTRNAYEQASHELVVLMHDDDYFLPGGLDALWRAWQAAGDAYDAVFGRQRVVNAGGVEQPWLTAQRNRKYHRLEPGPVPSNLWSVLVQQFPMNGMLLRRSLALAAGVPAEREVGGNTDVQFGIRYAAVATRPFLLVADEISAYRLSVDSKQRPGATLRLDGDLTYRALAALRPVGPLEGAAVELALARAAGSAVLAFAARGERREALAIFARHRSRLRVPPATKLKLFVVVAGLRLGLRWPEEMLRRRGLGLPLLWR